MVKNIKYNADASDLAAFMNTEKSVYYAYILFGIMAFFIFLVELTPFVFNVQDVNEKAYQVLLDIKSIESEVSLTKTFQKFNLWINRFGTTGEEIAYSLIAIGIFNFSLFVHETFSSSSIIISLTIILGTSILQIFFVLMACWKVWLAFVIYASIKALLSVKPYVGRDLLGVTGNGKVFFSGVKVGIKQCDKDGNPTLHVTGLTCLSYVSDEIFKKSAFYQLLVKYESNNLTNQYLASIILNYYEYPVFINDGVRDGSLFEDSYEFLKLACEIKYEIEHVANKSNIDFSEDRKKKCLFLCLTDNMRKNLKNISYKNIATAILALEAGRILAYEQISSDRWAIQSNYPHLCARAVLHSSPYYGDEYDFYEREMIRKALIFAERKSDFLAIRMPLNMSVESYTLRQWLELILNFDKADLIVDELLFFAESTEVHKRWTTILVNSIREEKNLSNNFFVADGGQLFIKINCILSILPEDFKKNLWMLSPLIEKVYNDREKNNLISQVEQKKLSDDNNDFLKKFSDETIKNFKKYSLTDNDIIVWQNLRSCLNAFSWLGKRVSDRYVSYTAVVDCKFLMDTDEIKDEKGMVLFRTSKLIDFIGHKWSEPIEKIKKVKISKNSAMKLEGVDES